MKTTVDHIIERFIDGTLSRDFYRVIVSEERKRTSGNGSYDHIVWVGECKAHDWEWMKRFSRKHGARFRGVQIKHSETEYMYEAD